MVDSPPATLDSVTEAHHSMRESIIALFDNLSRLATRLEPILAADSNTSARDPHASCSCPMVAEVKETHDLVVGAQAIVASMHDRLRL
jgi:hypothetical protein